MKSDVFRSYFIEKACKEHEITTTIVLRRLEEGFIHEYNEE